MEMTDDAFVARVAGSYAEIAARSSQRVVVLDGAQATTALHDVIARDALTRIAFAD